MRNSSKLNTHSALEIVDTKYIKDISNDAGLCKH